MMNRELALDALIIEALKDSASVFLSGTELNTEDKLTLRSLLEVISYYSKHSDFSVYYTEHETAINSALAINKVAPNEFVVEFVEELSDGSARVDVEMGSEIREKLFEEGLNFLMLKGILGGTTNQVTIWAQLGKQQEKTDLLVDSFNEIYNEDTK